MSDPNSDRGTDEARGTGSYPTPAATDVATVDSPEKPGAVLLGRYKLLKQIGEGGMGTVWAAEQLEPVKRTVAVKVIKSGMDSAHVQARFEQERQALALMDHPNIARVFDGGVTADWRPFLVMELVTGTPLTKFCDESKLSLRERLELFAAVCQAVQHAHQKGIIHRDLKPSNILVSHGDGKPFPKVIDFGVAKPVIGKLTDLTLATQFGAVVGTLEYMAPEQASASARDVDTRADVYALGVILYELLTGLRPFDAERLRRAAFDEAVRILRDEEPPKPSTRLSSDATFPERAAARQAEPKDLASRLRGELDWVVMKCLEKDRNRRYETANALARDVQRYLADEPVEACPPSVRYRLRKFVARNKLQVTAAAVVAVALILGVAGTTGGMLWALASQRDAVAARNAEHQQGLQTAAERDRALTAETDAKNQTAAATAERNRAEIAAQFVVGMFRRTDPGAKGADLKVVDFLDDAERNLLEFRGDPDSRAAMQDALFATWIALGEFDRVRTAVVPVITDRETQFGVADRRTLRAVNFHAQALRSLGRVAEAVPLAERCWQALGTAPAGDDDAATFGGALGETYLDAARYPEAIVLFEEILARRETANDPARPTAVLAARNNLAMAFDRAGRFAEAIPILQRVVRDSAEQRGPTHADTLRARGNLATILQRAGRNAEALQLYDGLIAGLESRFGPTHPTTLAARGNYAGILLGADRPKDAATEANRAARALDARYGPRNPETLAARNVLALALGHTGKREESVRLLEALCPDFEATFGKDHLDYLTVLQNLVVGYADLDRIADAIRVGEEVLPRQAAKLGDGHYNVALTRNALSTAYVKANRPADAERILAPGLAAHVERLGNDHPILRTMRCNLATAMVQLKRPLEGVPPLEAALAVSETTPGPDHADTLDLRLRLATVFTHAGRIRDAIRHRERALKTIDALRGPGSDEALNMRNMLGNQCGNVGDRPAAIRWFESALEESTKAHGKGHATALRARSNLAVALWNEGRLDRSVPLFEENFKLTTEALGPDDPETLRAATNLAINLRDAGRLTDALPRFEDAVKRARAKPEAHAKSMAFYLESYAAALDAAGRSADAEPLWDEVLKIYKKSPGVTGNRTISVVANLGMCRVRIGKYTDAETALRAALAHYEKESPDGWFTACIRNQLGAALLGQKKYADAEPFLVEGYRAMQQWEDKIPPRSRFRLTHALQDLVQLYDAQGKKAEAEPYRKALADRKP